MQYNENEIEKILQEYKLSDEEHKELYNTIKRIWTLDKFPVENPIAVIIGGQTGAAFPGGKVCGQNGRGYGNDTACPSVSFGRASCPYSQK